MDEKQVGQWAILPAMVRYDPAIPANAKLIYAEIAAKINEDGYCFCHNRHFAERFGLSEDRASALIRQLEKAGYIQLDIDKARVNRDRRRIYLTAKPYDFVPKGGIGENAGTPRGIGENADTVSAKMPGPIENNNLKSIPPISPKGGGRERKAPKKEPEWKPERFKGFWEYYPRGEAKQKAIEAWDKARLSDEEIAFMGRRLKDQMSREDWQRGVGVPYASTYLNQRRWEDEVKPGAAAAAVTADMERRDLPCLM